MVPEGWLKPSLILPGVSADTVEQLVERIVPAVAAAANLEPVRVRGAFLHALEGEGFSVGSGVAMPHTELQELSETIVCVVTLPKPISLPTIDGRAPDIFFFILSKPDPEAHLLLLAHLARMCQSRTFLDGLRRAGSVDEIMSLVSAVELRHAVQRTSLIPPAAHAVVLISISGEKAVDALLVDLMDLGFDQASVFEGQSLHEATAREVPLFAGFRDIFGDPGGSRVVLLEVRADRSDEVLSSVQRVCQDHKAKDARVAVLPVLARWALPRPAAEGTSGGH